MSSAGPVTLNVLRPFLFCTPQGVRGSRERRFTRGTHTLDPANPDDAAVLAHPWICEHYADGAIETPAQEIARLAREAVEAARAQQRAQAAAAALAEAQAAEAVRVKRMEQGDIATAPPPAATTASTPRVSDWRPNYTAIFAERVERLQRLRADSAALPPLKCFYTAHPEQFIADWGVTLDPRNTERGWPSLVPFVLWPRQVEFIHWCVERWRKGESGLIEKSRDSGASWLSIALSCTLCLFTPGLVVGYGSRKLELVDQLGSPRSAFEKARIFLEHLPAEFLGGWSRDKHAPLGRILFPSTGSVLHGEGGDQVGRGDRCAIYWVDEAAFLEHPALVDGALAGTTNTRLDISTPAGRGNSFAGKRFAGNLPVFTMSWRDDPRKDDAWLARKVLELDEVTVAQEILCDYNASVEGVLIPAAWADAAVGAAGKLGIKPTGAKRGGFDVADAGVDRNCYAARHGVHLYGLESWSGKASDIYASVLKAFSLADAYGTEWVYYDGDGLGAGVRGDARTVNDARKSDGRRRVHFAMFRGSSAPFDPEHEQVPGRKNKDFFANAKAAAWWHLRTRFQNTFRAVVDGLKVDPDDIISIDPQLPELGQLLAQLQQPTYSLNNAGKVIVDKKPDGTSSPDRADAVMICYQPGSSALETWLRLAPS
jgi:phage terminase large subunit